MKVLIINGSPRVGGNTTLALSQMTNIFKENGIDILGGEFVVSIEITQTTSRSRVTNCRNAKRLVELSQSFLMCLA